MPGTVIRRYREMKNYSQKYVAAKMGISQNAYSKIENNLTQLTVHHIKQLSEILQTPVSELLKDEYEIHKPLLVPGKAVQKEDLLNVLDQIRQKLQKRHAVKHESYTVSMTLLATVDNLISHVY